jgi:hypothetical protein
MVLEGEKIREFPEKKERGPERSRESGKIPEQFK